jgi:hypothetical protein
VPRGDLRHLPAYPQAVLQTGQPRIHGRPAPVPAVVYTTYINTTPERLWQLLETGDTLPVG